MLNAVSSGSRLTNVTPLRSGASRSNSCGARTRRQAATVSAATSSTAIGSGDRWPLRFGSLTATPHTPGSLTSGATGRVADVPARPVALPPRHHHVIADLAGEHARRIPVHRHVADELEGGLMLVVLGKIGRHLERRVEHHVQRQLFGERRPGAGLLGPARSSGTARDPDVEDT